jgi:thiamine-monophosphate kinase
LNEFDLIRRYFTPPTRHTVLAGGDDAALIAVRPEMEVAVSTDALVSGQHFFAEAEPRAIGYKSLAVNLSDLAAMGAIPRWATLSLTLPDADPVWLERFSEGFLSIAQDHDVDLIGGDTTRGALTVCVTIIGEVEAGRALRRSGARPGDELWVSGTIGDAALAVAHLRGDLVLQPAERAGAMQRLDYPQPRVKLGRGLLELATSCIDISDGLVADVGHLGECSGVHISIELDALPRSALALRYCDHPIGRRAVLAGGDDYELAFTAPAAHRSSLEALAGRGVALTCVGRVEPGSGVSVVDRSGVPMILAETGFDHFR